MCKCNTGFFCIKMFTELFWFFEMAYTKILLPRYDGNSRWEGRGLNSRKARKGPNKLKNVSSRRAVSHLPRSPSPPLADGHLSHHTACAWAKSIACLESIHVLVNKLTGITAYSQFCFYSQIRKLKTCKHWQTGKVGLPSFEQIMYSTCIHVLVCEMTANVYSTVKSCVKLSASA